MFIHFLTRWYFLFIFVICLVGSSYALFHKKNYTEEKKANHLFHKGHQAYHNYNYQAAISYLFQAISDDPEHMEARQLLGKSLYFLGNMQQAIQEWSDILVREPENLIVTSHLQHTQVFNKQDTFSFTFSKLFDSQRRYQFILPTFAGSLPNQHMFVLAQDKIGNGNLIEIDVNGHYVNNLRKISGDLAFPVAGVVGNHELWVTDYKKDIIHRMPWKDRLQVKFFSPLESIGKRGSKELEFRGPAGLCYLNHHFYVVDSGNQRIQRISEKGTFSLWFDETNDGKLKTPFGIACRSNGDIYVTESSAGRVSIFDEFGNFKQYFASDLLVKPRHVQLSPDERLLTIADQSGFVLIIDLITQQNTKISHYPLEPNSGRKEPFYSPYSAFVDRFHNLFITDHTAHRLIQFTPKQFLLNNLEVWLKKIDIASFPTIGLWLSVNDLTHNNLVNLKKTNFTIFENGLKKINISHGDLQQFQNQMNVVIVYPKSKSMRTYEDVLLWLIDSVLHDVRSEDKIKAVAYTDHYVDTTLWTNSKITIKNNIQKSFLYTQYTAQTRANQALYYSGTQLLSKRGKKAIIWIVNEIENSDFDGNIRLKHLQHFLRNNNIPLYILSVQNQYTDVDTKTHILKSLAEKTQGLHSFAYQSSIKNINQHIRSQSQKNYLLYYTTNASSNWKGQYVKLRVDVNFRDRVGSTKGGYFIP